jgi:hypothetical protein
MQFGSTLAAGRKKSSPCGVSPTMTESPEAFTTKWSSSIDEPTASGTSKTIDFVSRYDVLSWSGIGVCPVVGVAVSTVLLYAVGFYYGGEGGIRTHGTRKGSTVFETARFNHSRTSPSLHSSWFPNHLRELSPILCCLQHWQRHQFGTTPCNQSNRLLFCVAVRVGVAHRHRNRRMAKAVPFPVTRSARI